MLPNDVNKAFLVSFSSTTRTEDVNRKSIQSFRLNNSPVDTGPPETKSSIGKPNSIEKFEQAYKLWYLCKLWILIMNLPLFPLAQPKNRILLIRYLFIHSIFDFNCLKNFHDHPDNFDTSWFVGPISQKPCSAMGLNGYFLSFGILSEWEEGIVCWCQWKRQSDQFDRL